MVAFIIQEAQEKCKEIKLKTDTEFNLEKSTLIHNGKIKVNEEYAQKEKDLQSAQRVSASASTMLWRVLTSSSVMADWGWFMGVVDEDKGGSKRRNCAVYPARAVPRKDESCAARTERW